MDGPRNRLFAFVSIACLLASAVRAAEPDAEMALPKLPPESAPGLVEPLREAPMSLPDFRPARAEPHTGLAEPIPPGRPEPLPGRPDSLPRRAGEPEFELFEFRDLPLVEALRVFSEQTGLNVVASREATEQTVSLYLRNVTASEALQALAKSNNLWTRVDPESGVVHVSTTEEYDRDLATFRDERTMEQITQLIRRLDVPTPLVLLEVKILSVALGDGFNSVFDYQFSDAASVAGGFTSGNILPPVTDNLNRIVPPRTRRDSPINPETSSDWNNVASNEDLTFQFVNDHFRFRMQLLESKNRVTTLATPLLLTANNEVSRIFIGQTEPFTIGFESPQIVATGTTQTNISGTPITELRDVGQLLLITPSINADRTVTLRIAQQQSRKDEGGATIPVLDTQGQVQQVAVDTVSRQTASGTIVAKDGLTVVLGGLIEEEVADVRAEVPIIGKLPVVGFFFRRQATTRDRNETLIMVRPYVFNTPPESAALSEMRVRDLSVHPTAYDGQPTLNSHAPWEAVRPDPPCNELENTFRFHSVRPRRY
ncbi:MAG: hypothetical protein ACOCWL_03440 [Thermoguttaceae bacterium]